MPSSLPRKRKAGDEPARASSSSSSKKTAGSSSSAAAFTSRLATISSSLSTSQDLNPLADLTELIASYALSLPSDTLIPALTLLLRTLVHLVRVGHVDVRVVDYKTGMLRAVEGEGDDAAAKVSSWLKARFNDAVQTLTRVLAAHPKEKSRIAALNALMELQRVASTAVGAWAECPWQSIITALFPTDADADAAVDAAPALAVFTHDYVEEYADVRMAFYRAVSHSRRSISRTRALDALLALSTPPTTKAGVKAMKYLCDDAVQAVKAHDKTAASGKKPKKAKSKKAKYTEDGGSDGGDDDDSDEESDESEDLNWFSDSDNDGGDGEANPRKQSKSASTSTPSSTRPRRRRSGALSRPIFTTLSDPKSWRVNLDAAWLAVIVPRGIANASAATTSTPTPTPTSSSPPPLSSPHTHSILRVMEKRILPFLSRPQLIADWLLDCLDVGGSTALLALSPLYTLYVSHSLSLPSLYSTLYGLLTPALLHSPHRSHSLRLLALFLSSDKLPLVTVLAFIKRLARLALRGPPGGIIPVVIITYNLLKRHKDGMGVVHQGDGGGDSSEDAWRDPYLPSLSLSPASTNALHTSLIELASLGALNPNAVPSLLTSTRGEAATESHYHAATTTIVKILAQPFTKEAYDLEEFLDHGYATLIKTEVERSEAAEKRRAAGKSVAAPAVRFALEAQAGGKRVRVFPRARSEQKNTTAPAHVDVDGNAPTASPLALAAPRTGFTPHRSRSPSPSAPPPGLDDEEREAWEAMQEVKREEREREQEKVMRAGGGRAGVARRDVMALWAY